MTAFVAFVVPVLITTCANTFATQIYVSVSDEIWTADLDGSNAKPLPDNQNGSSTQLALDRAGGKMYLAQCGAGAISRANLDGTAYEQLVARQPAPFGVAVDLENGKLYWSDRDLEKIQRANLDGTSVEDVVTGLDNSHHLALDVASEMIYWAENRALGTQVIRRASINGGSFETLVISSGRPHGIALDLSLGNIYWTDFATGQVERSILDGSDRQVVLSGLGGLKGIALDLTAGKMYLADAGEGKIQRADLDGSNLIDLVSIPEGDIKGVTLDLHPIPEPSSLAPLPNRRDSSHCASVSTVEGQSTQISSTAPPLRGLN